MGLSDPRAKSLDIIPLQTLKKRKRLTKWDLVALGTNLNHTY